MVFIFSARIRADESVGPPGAKPTTMVIGLDGKLSACAATMPASATQMYAKNLQTLIKHLVKDGSMELDLEDEITKGATITHGGKVVQEATLKALGKEA